MPLGSGSTPIYDAEGVISLDASRLQGGVNQARASLGSLYDVIRDNWWGVRNVGMAFAGMGAAIVGGVAASVKAAADFDQAMIAVARTSGIADETGKQYSEDLATLSDQLREIARTRPVDISVVTDIAEQAGALGIAKENIAGFTEGIVDLVATTNLTPDTAAKLARVANVFNYTDNKQFQQLDSAVYSLGVNSAATESEIVGMSTRLAGFGHQAGLSSAEVTALAATTISLGQRPYSATTALQRTFEGLASAASEGGPLLHNFAEVAGVTADHFKQMVINDPNEALTRFLEGLGKHGSNLVAANDIFNKLGINEQLQIQALQALGSGTQTGAESWKNYRYAADQANQSFEDGNVVQDAAAKQYQSATNQLKILGNTIHDVGIGFGSLFLPELRLATTVANDFFTGIEALPGPLRAALGVLAAVGGVVMLGAGSFILFGQRAILAKNEFALLATTVKANAAAAIAAASATAAAEGEAASSSLLAAFAAGNTAKARGAAAAATAAEASAAELATVVLIEESRAADLLTLAQGRRAAAEIAASEGDLEAAAAASLAATSFEAQAASAMAAAGAAEVEALALTTVVPAATAAETASYALGAAIDFMLGPVGWAILAIGALVAAVTLLGHSHKSESETAKEFAKAEDDLVTAIQREEEGLKGAVAAVLAQKLAHSGAITMAKEFGISVSTLSDMIRGLNNEMTRSAIATLQKQIAAGNGDAQKLADIIGELNDSLVASAQVAHDSTEASKELGAADDSAGDSALKLQDATEKKADAAKAANEALIALAQGELSLRDGTISVAEAERELRAALHGTNNAAINLRKAEDELAAARIDQRKAALAERDAEKALRRARHEEHLEEVKDEAALKQARINYHQSLLKVTEAEQALDKLRSGPTLDDLTKAVNELHDAQDDLYNSQVKAADAQWQLNYLMGEGASARDIADAEETLTEARHDVADATQDVADKQGDLDDLRDGASADELKAAELDYQEALLASKKDLQDVKDAQADLRQIRRDIAHDRAYKDAEDALKTAQIRLHEANLKVRQSTKDLHREQSGAAQDDRILAAQQGLVDALFSQAQGIANVREQQAIANGETVTAADKAGYLADALEQMAGKANGPVANQLRSYAAVLRNTTPENRTTKVHADTSGAVKAVHELKVKHNETFDDMHSKEGHWYTGLMGFFSDGLEGWKLLGEHMWNSWHNDVDKPIGRFFTEQIPGWYGSAHDFFNRDLRDPIEDFFGKGGKFRGFFTGIGDAVSGGMHAAGNQVIDILNGLIHAWNALWDNIGSRKVTFDFPNWLPGVPDDWSIGLSFLKDMKVGDIDRFAEGGIVNSPTLGMFGEAGAEAVIPLDRLWAMFAPLEEMTVQLSQLNDSLTLMVGSGGAGSSMQIEHQGNNFYIETHQGATAEEVVDEMLWHQLRSRK